MPLTCITCAKPIVDIAEDVRLYGTIHEPGTPPYMHFRADRSDPTGSHGYYYPSDHPASPTQAYAA